MLISLIYGSSAIHTMTEDDLISILNKARQNNQQLDVTGILLYRNGNFLQVLEGEADTVNTLFNKIQQDPRHRGIIEYIRRPIQEREFTEWEMGFLNLSQTNTADLEGYSNFLVQSLPPEDQFNSETYSMAFLRIFRDLLR